MAVKTHNIAVIGGGFAGLRAISALVDKGVDLTLYEPRKATVMLPALPDVAGGWVGESLTSAPFVNLLPLGIRHESSRVETLDLHKLEVTAAGTKRNFDAVIIASGARATPCPFNREGQAAYSLDSLESALRLRAAFLKCLTESPEPHVVIAGGGYTGLETAAALAARARAENKPCRVTVIERGAEIMSFLPEKRRAVIIAALEQAGIELLNNTEVTGWDGNRVEAGERSFENVLFCWTVGSVFADLKIEQEVERLPDGRIVVEPDLSVPGFKGVFVAGDAAAVLHRGAPLRKAVNFAWYGGNCAGRNASAFLQGRPAKRYRPRDLGWAIPLHTTGVGQVGTFFWFGGSFALRVHYLMCGVRSPRLNQKTGFAKIAFKLFGRRKERKTT